MEKFLWTGCAVALAGALVACGDNDNTAVEPAAGDEMVAVDVDVSTTLPAMISGTYPVVEVSGTENGVVAVPAPYRGKWAANANACEDGWWRFDDLETETSKGVSCALTDVENPAESVSTTLVLTCEGEGMTAKERWEVSQPQGGQMMLMRRAEEVQGSGDYKDQGDVMPLMECPATAAEAKRVPSTLWARG